jgi:hypothetical protein
MKMNKSLVTRFVFAAILAVAVAATGCGSDDNGGAGSGGAGSGGDGGGGNGGDGGDGGGGNGGAVAGPTIEMTAPTGGDAVLPGNVVTIEWTAMDDVGVTGVDLSYTTTTDGGTTVSDPVMIATDEQGTSYAWTTPTDAPLYGVTIKGVAKNAAGQTGEDETEAIFAVVQFSERGYVTGRTCGDCHAEHEEWVYEESGHPYKLNKVEGGVAPSYPNGPNSTPGVLQPPQDSTPPNLTWDDVTYVIGGYGWKARFLGADGFIIGTGFGDPPTGGGSNQYNFVYDPPTWTNYHQDDLTPKPYDCGQCHTTGWQSLADNGGVNQDGLPGIEGTWEETGITCEQCHGGGGVDHVSTQLAADITIDTSSELCGSCHNRGGTNADIPASNGFIRHHEQYNEWANSGHGDGVGEDVSCNTCHDPHIGTRYDFADMGGIIATCESCHAEQAANNSHSVPVDCVTCHMAQASKSAVADPANLLYVGDVKTHIFGINTAAVGKDTFFTADGLAVETPTAGVTLDFVCYQCHADGNGGGGTAFERTLQQLSDKAIGIHDAP